MFCMMSGGRVRICQLCCLLILDSLPVLDTLTGGTYFFGTRFLKLTHHQTLTCITRKTRRRTTAPSAEVGIQIYPHDLCYDDCYSKSAIGYRVHVPSYEGSYRTTCMS